MITLYLFVGGPEDGRTGWYEDEPMIIKTIEMLRNDTRKAMRDCRAVKEHIYKRCCVSCMGMDYFYYLHESIQERDAFGYFLKGYRPFPAPCTEIGKEAPVEPWQPFPKA